MHFVNPYAYVYNQFKIHTAQKRIYFDMIITRRVLPVLKLLHQLNLVRRFYFLAKTKPFEQKVRIFPFYNKTQTIISNFKLHFHKTHPVTIKYQALKLLQKSTGGSSLILNTPQGLMTHRSALTHKVGGVLIYTIY